MSLKEVARLILMSTGLLASASAAQALVTSERNVIHVTYDITMVDTKSFLRQFNTALFTTDISEPIFVELNSPGGDIRAAFEIASMIKSAEAHGTKVITRLAPQSECRSACTYVFAAANHRHAHESAEFTFHGITYSGWQTDKANIARQTKTYLAKGLTILAEADAAFARHLDKVGTLRDNRDYHASAAELKQNFSGFLTEVQTR